MMRLIARMMMMKMEASDVVGVDRCRSVVG